MRMSNTIKTKAILFTIQCNNYGTHNNYLDVNADMNDATDSLSETSPCEVKKILNNACNSEIQIPSVLSFIKIDLNYIHFMKSKE